MSDDSVNTNDIIDTGERYWDVFKCPDEERISGAESFSCILKVTRLVTYLFLFIMVLGMGIVSTCSLILITSTSNDTFKVGIMT